MRETVPDAVLASADDVVLIDVTPESLVQRLLEGKVYPAERVQGALSNFFKLENLSALREVALRQVAEEIESKRVTSEPAPRGRGERLIEAVAPQAIGERLLALITPQPHAQRVVRRAWRSAQRLGAELDILWVADHQPTTRRVSRSRRCAGWRACSARTCWSSTAMTWRSWPSRSPATVARLTY